MNLLTIILTLFLAGAATTLALWLLATLIWTIVLRKALAVFIAAAAAGLAQLAVLVLTFPRGPIAADHFFSQVGVFITAWPAATLVLMNASGFLIASWGGRGEVPVASFGWAGVFVWTLRQVRLEQDAAYVPPAIEGFLQEDG